MFKKIFSILLILIILSNTVIGIKTVDSVVLSSHNSPIVRKPIYIEGNENFTAENGVSSGNGTIDNPYVICDFIIKIRFSDVFKQKETRGIYIGNTDAYFIIKDIQLEFIDGIICYYYFYNILGKEISAINFL